MTTLKKEIVEKSRDKGVKRILFLWCLIPIALLVVAYFLWIDGKNIIFVNCLEELSVAMLVADYVIGFFVNWLNAIGKQSDEVIQKNNLIVIIYSDMKTILRSLDFISTPIIFILAIQKQWSIFKLLVILCIVGIVEDILAKMISDSFKDRLL